jgi:hypothetical protein
MGFFAKQSEPHRMRSCMLTGSRSRAIVEPMIDAMRTLLAAAVLTLMACGSSTSSDGDAGRDVRRGADGGGSGAVATDAALSAITIRVSTNPDPLRIGTSTTFHLTITGADGKPVVGATVDVTWFMTTMPDMGGTAVVTEQGNGVYLAQPMDFSMEGSWKVTVTVNVAGQNFSKVFTYELS